LTSFTWFVLGENTPEFIEDDELSEFMCCEFIDKYATCKRVDDGLLGKYVAYQIHKHSHTCRKNQNEDNCCFNFPRPPMEKTRIFCPPPTGIYNFNNFRELLFM